MSNSIRTYAAALELDRVAALSAFNIKGAIWRAKINQHATVYAFSDGSRLHINHTSARGHAWHTGWRGDASDIANGPVQNVPLRINTRGAA